MKLHTACPVTHQKLISDTFSALKAQNHLVDKGTALAYVEPGILLRFAALNVEECCVLSLIPQATLVASEDSLGVEPRK